MRLVDQLLKTTLPQLLQQPPMPVHESVVRAAPLTRCLKNSPGKACPTTQ